MGNIGFYYMLIVVMVIWMAIKVGRDSTGMGIATFLFWPIAIIPLITNWGRRDNDIRLQFLVVSVATVLLMNSAVKVVTENAALIYSPDDIEQIRAEDPAFAAEIEREQLRALGVEIVVEEGPAGMAPAAVAPTASVDSRGEAEPVFSAAPAQIRKVPLGELNFRRGQVRLAPAYARLNVPEHFRFVARHQLGLLAEIRQIEIDERTLGWLVHERVDLRSPQFWFVDVQFHDAGHLAAPAAEGTVPAGLGWDPQAQIASFSRISTDAAKGQDQATAKLLRHGALVFRVPELAKDQLELGLRAARLMATQVESDSGWSYADFSGVESGQSLLQWVEAFATQAEARVLAEREDGAG
ncbi:MAG TPA: hypothetical protein VN259_07405 [Xanthomonadales bacterium]|nr:hypothetical protein [Xanthomonadales bacterium]